MQMKYRRGKMRVGVAAFWHETNTFAMEHNDSMDDANIHRGEALLANANSRSFIGGFVEGTEHTDIELVPTVRIAFTRGGIVHADVYESCRNMIVESLREAGPLDGIYFDFHGAMVAEAPYTDAEGELIKEW